MSGGREWFEVFRWHSGPRAYGTRSRPGRRNRGNQQPMVPPDSGNRVIDTPVPRRRGK